MKRTFLKKTAAFCMVGALLASPLSSLSVKATPIDLKRFNIKQSKMNQLLTEDITLTSKYLTGDVTYSVGDADSRYVSVEGNVLKINRPIGGEGNYSFTLKATVTKNGESSTKDFPLTIAEGYTEDTMAGYLYCCFTDTPGDNKDVQQIHFYLSEDGMNWTALNGNQPIFLTGNDYIDTVEKAGPKSVNYVIKDGTDVTKTVTGDASVLFPFEGKDQGVRDPYLVRGAKADGSDANKTWLLATDLNMHSANYGDGNNLANNVVGNWGWASDSEHASQSLFVWETDDWVHWTRRYIDVGSEVDADMAWAPEAIYNPEKDNYLVFWSGRTNTDGSSRNRLYCNETDDFVTFGPTMMYEQEAFYEKYGEKGKSNNSGYGNIDTSMLWVAGTDDKGNQTDYKTLYRLVKDETNNHIELQSSSTVFDPNVTWSKVVKDEASGEWVEVTKNSDGKYVDAQNQVRTERVWDYVDPSVIKPYEYKGVTYATLDDLKKLSGDSNDIGRAEIVYNWFKDDTVGDHFVGIDQEVLQFGGTSTTTYHEGATMFKFNDRDEWCIMVDNYGNMSIRYEPYTTTDLSVPNSVSKVESGYGRTGGDIGCHGTMIPVSVAEYNKLIDTYNDKSKMTGLNAAALSNYHEIAKISTDTRNLEATAAQLEELSKNEKIAEEKRNMYRLLAIRANRMLEDDYFVDEQTIKNFVDYAQARMEVSVTASASEVTLSVGKSQKVTAETTPAFDVTWNSADPSVATVAKDGTIKATGKGSTFVFAKADKKAMAVIKVTVK